GFGVNCSVNFLSWKSDILTLFANFGRDLQDYPVIVPRKIAEVYYEGKFQQSGSFRGPGPADLGGAEPDPETHPALPANHRE
ncbi:MAG: hypothetical protein ACYTEK_20265, partial [Planctomycetota bacterium]